MTICRKKHISVIVRTRNRSKLLERCLRSILHQHSSDLFRYELIVVDNGSTDETRSVVESIKKESPIPIRYCFEPKEGATYALNRGVLAAVGDYIAFCDDDQTAHPEWLLSLSNSMNHGRISITGGSILLNLSAEHYAGLGRVSRELLGEHLYSGVNRAILGKSIPSIGNMMISRTLLDQIGLFDPSFRSGGEDTDFILRAKAAGHEIWIAPDAIVFHEVSAYRMKWAYLKWVSMRWGSVLAQKDAASQPRTMLIGRICARWVQVFAIIFPKLLYETFFGKTKLVMDANCLIFRTIAYSRTALSLVFPDTFKQEKYFDGLTFSRESELFMK